LRVLSGNGTNTWSFENVRLNHSNQDSSKGLVDLLNSWSKSGIEIFYDLHCVSRDPA
jgi:hypothetical protein